MELDLEYVTMIELLVIQELYNLKKGFKPINPWVKIKDEKEVYVELESASKKYIDYFETFEVLDFHDGNLKVKDEFFTFKDVDLARSSEVYDKIMYLNVSNYVKQALYTITQRGVKVKKEYLGDAFLQDIINLTKSIL